MCYNCSAGVAELLKTLRSKCPNLCPAFSLAIKPCREAGVLNALKDSCKLVAEALWAYRFSENDGEGHSLGVEVL